MIIQEREKLNGGNLLCFVCTTCQINIADLYQNLEETLQREVCTRACDHENSELQGTRLMMYGCIYKSSVVTFGPNCAGLSSLAYLCTITHKLHERHKGNSTRGLATKLYIC
ncbi:hypothetical protein AVEN_274924-1 [Araneus ventricosus]|uniref:Uncharacterized protein n=1 Tax=Araneus ventricosus TaxID=182803 RepID=A0A4Y2WEQ0_ARAVE|nr:hypothetical protein AVEN_274924-1 [Araneus ventricosus]